MTRRAAERLANEELRAVEQAAEQPVEPVAPGSPVQLDEMELQEHKTRVAATRLMLLYNVSNMRFIMESMPLSFPLTHTELLELLRVGGPIVGTWYGHDNAGPGNAWPTNTRWSTHSYFIMPVLYLSLEELLGVPHVPIYWNVDVHHFSVHTAIRSMVYVLRWRIVEVQLRDIDGRHHLSAAAQERILDALPEETVNIVATYCDQQSQLFQQSARRAAAAPALMPMEAAEVSPPRSSAVSRSQPRSLVRMRSPQHSLALSASAPPGSRQRLVSPMMSPSAQRAAAVSPNVVRGNLFGSPPHPGSVRSFIVPGTPSAPPRAQVVDASDLQVSVPPAFSFSSSQPRLSEFGLLESDGVAGAGNARGEASEFSLPGLSEYSVQEIDGWRHTNVRLPEDMENIFGNHIRVLVQRARGTAMQDDVRILVGLYIRLYTREAGMECPICMTVHYDGMVAVQPCGHIICGQCSQRREDGIAAAREAMADDPNAPPPADPHQCFMCRRRYINDPDVPNYGIPELQQRLQPIRLTMMPICDNGLMHCRCAPLWAHAASESNRPSPWLR